MTDFQEIENIEIEHIYHYQPLDKPFKAQICPRVVGNAWNSVHPVTLPPPEFGWWEFLSFFLLLPMPEPE
jgi:hypothetical protein